MEKHHIDVEKRLGFTHAVAVDSGDMRTIYISGQTGQSEGLEAQSKEAFNGLQARLEAAGASAEDVVKLTTYIVDYTPEKIPAAFSGFGAVFKDRERPPANTVVGVQALFQPNLLIEIEAVAVVARKS
ncbi:MAG: RidA family protein [Pseudomonadota bacterium]